MQVRAANFQSWSAREVGAGCRTPITESDVLEPLPRPAGIVTQRLRKIAAPYAATQQYAIVRQIRCMSPVCPPLNVE
jgi:hypothetical protein